MPIVALDVGDQQVPVDGIVTDLTLAPVEVATTIVSGLSVSSDMHDTVGPVYGELARWAEDQGHSVTGLGRESCLTTLTAQS